MRFALRCTVALSIVYGAILLHDGAPKGTSLATDAVRNAPAAAASAGDRLIAGLGTACRHDPSACLAGATTLRRLLAEGGAASADRSRGAIGAIAR